MVCWPPYSPSHIGYGMRIVSPTGFWLPSFVYAALLSPVGRRCFACPPEISVEQQHTRHSLCAKCQPLLVALLEVLPPLWPGLVYYYYYYYYNLALRTIYFRVYNCFKEFACMFSYFNKVLINLRIACKNAEMGSTNSA